MPNLNLTILPSRNGVIWIFCETYLVDIIAMIEYPLGKGSISPPKHHQAIGWSTQKVIAWRIEMHIPDSLGVIAILCKQHLQSEAPKFYFPVYSSSQQIQLVRRKWRAGYLISVSYEFVTFLENWFLYLSWLYWWMVVIIIILRLSKRKRKNVGTHLPYFHCSPIQNCKGSPSSYGMPSIL